MEERQRIVWSPELEIGYSAIDQQHRKLFDLADALVSNGDLSRVMSTLGALSDYVVVHFRDEEKLMADIGFPGLNAHRELHNDFRTRLAKVYRHAGTLGLAGITAEVRELVDDWLVNHIMRVDREYAAYLVRRPPG